MTPLQFSLEPVDNALYDLMGLDKVFECGNAFNEFLAEDVVRHPLVQKIVSAYERHEQEKKQQP